VVRRLDAVETLGSVTVIATDKTGTLTENRMEVRHLDSPNELACLRAMVLVNDAEPGSDHGDPTEVALLRFAERTASDILSLRQVPRISMRPFDPGWKYMRVTVSEEGTPRSYLKGAPEVLLERAAMDDAERQSWVEKTRAYASEGHRVLGFAMVDGESEDSLIWLGIAMLWDPPRPEVPEAIRHARSAGIRVLMITGDHPETAVGVAQVVGIPGELVATGVEIERASLDQLGDIVQRVNVFARVTPEHKLRIVEALKATGEVVAVTGDGVNDAPALKRADIGIAMGQRGSDVSREAADLVLLDDNFATIVAAVEEGRNIYANIQTFIRFLFSTNLSEIIVVVIGMIAAFLLGLRDASGALLLPLTAVQLLWINLVTDGAPALALGMDKNPGVLERPPRDPSAALLDHASVWFIVPTGVAKGVLVLMLLWFLPRAGYSTEVTRTAAFTLLAAGQLLFAYPARRLEYQPLRNPLLQAAVFGGIALQAAILWITPLRAMLDAVALEWDVWGWVIAGMIVAWGFAELHTHWLRGRAGRAHPSEVAL
jgi:Ca2+-transporting ATPase